jgi:hypothetical protein
VRAVVLVLPCSVSVDEDVVVEIVVDVFDGMNVVRESVCLYGLVDVCLLGFWWVVWFGIW